jgi:hypothetical protein
MADLDTFYPSQQIALSISISLPLPFSVSSLPLAFVQV